MPFDAEISAEIWNAKYQTTFDRINRGVSHSR